MRIFKNKICKRVVSLLSIVAIFFCMDWGVGQLIQPISYATYFNHDLEMIEKSDYDSMVVFVGASRVYRTFVPKIFEEAWNVDCVLNAGSSSQPICGTYYELKDLVERVHPQKVYIGVTVDQLTENPAENLQGRLIVYDRLNLKNRFLMGLKCFNFEEREYFLNAYRYKDRLTKKKIKKHLKKVKKLKAANYKDNPKKNEYYADKGFVYNKDSFKTGTMKITEGADFSDDLIIKENLTYLDKCVDLCKKNNIEVHLVSGVTTVMRMYVSAGYQKSVDFYTEYAKKKGIRYYNLNFLKDREKNLPDEMMHDYNHLNGEGANITSEIFAEIVKKEEAGEDISSYFYKDLDDFKKDVKRIVAVNADIQEDKDKENVLHLQLTSLQNDDVKPRYRVSVRYSKGENYQVLSDWNESKKAEVKVAKKSGYTIRVEAGAENKELGTACRYYKFK